MSQLELMMNIQELLENWENCPVPDCEWKVCAWAGVGLCHPHSKDKLGPEEIQKRYEKTHTEFGVVLEEYDILEFHYRKLLKL